MKKLLLTENQLEMLVKYINEEHTNKEIIQEGWKDVVLGVAALMGVGLTGVNAQTANKALNDAETLKKIEKTLETPEIDTLIKTLNDKGLKNAEELIHNNADEIIDNYNQAAKKNNLNFKLSRLYTTKNPTVVKDKLKQGYAVKDVEVSYDTIIQKKGELQVASELELVFDANIFNTGTFDLSDSIMDEISSSVNGIVLLGGKITGVEVVSSTDTEPIRMGNDALAQKRADGVVRYLNSIGVDVTPVVKLNPNSGPDIYSKSMTSSERKEARVKTAEFRYVKVIIHSVVEPAPQKEETVVDIIKKVKYTLVKGDAVKTYKVKTPVGKKGLKTKGFKCKKVKVKGNVTSCEGLLN